MRNIVFLSISLCVATSFGSEKGGSYRCDVVGKNIVRCVDTKTDDAVVSMGLYRINKDGSVTKKEFFANNYYEDNEKSWVRVTKIGKVTDWPCLALENAENGLSYKVVSGSCLEDADDFIGMIKSGKEITINGHDYDDPLDDIGEEEAIMAIFCESFTHVITERRNKITKLRTDRREYRNLSYSSHCEDFFASEALYWKP